MRRVLGAALTTAVLATGGCAAAETGPEYTSLAVITAEQQATVEQAYARIREYWGSRLTARMVLLEKEGQVLCDERPGEETLFATALDGPKYCVSADTIVITGFFTSVMGPKYAQGDPAVAAAGITFAVAHEGYHGVQNGEGKKMGYLAIELEADHQAGCFMGQSGGGEYYSAEQRAAAVKFVGGIPGDPDHGSTDQRVTVFQTGLDGIDC